MGWTLGEDDDEKISSKLSETKKQEGCRKRGRPQLGIRLFEGRHKKGKRRRLSGKRPTSGSNEKITKVTIRRG